MRERPTGTVTLLFSDIEGSTHLLQQSSERYADLLAECCQLLRTAFHQWTGYEVDTQGDSIFIAFARASDASRQRLRCNKLSQLMSGPMG
jgi:class 3 adenylate cyclase